MKDYQSDKYENFFLHLRASREGLVRFADFTATAVAAPGVDATVAGHGVALATATAALRAELVTRKGQGGGSQTSTDAEGTAFEAFKTFVQATDKKVLTGYLYDHAAERATYYPDGLTGLTRAPVKERLTRFTAYTEALEASPDAAVKAQGAAARALLKKYEKASTTKTQARTELQDTINDLGPAAAAVAETLWDVHTAACYAHRRAPLQARKYFDYAGLPSRAGSKKAAKPTP
ncbi:hypothetical protein ACFST9_11875 [Hymenobacter monticola]|uniref:Uncharacterized protein n=1 Tax=Hymenobacter monticola TaxID=1705399 RepID=A0ABY4B8A9_9BACT|nr:hypothetical protein [Hymenobacter monticola]UOE35109.1 hypothetical protein MTP16_05535 [Hymenobacter monticola]